MSTWASWSSQLGKVELANMKSQVDKIAKQENNNVNFTNWQNKVDKLEK